MANNKNSRKRRKKKKSRKLLLFVFEVLLLAVLLLVAYFVSMMNRIKYENLDESEAGINSDLDENTILSLEGYTNIALFGLDHRSPVHADIFLDIKIQIGIEHLYCLLRTTMCICRV